MNSSFPKWRPLSQPQVVLVIGVQRSGTSVLTKGLETMGVSLGSTLIPSGTYNEKGFWEDEDFHALNLKMLNSFGDRFRLVLSITEEEASVLCEKGFFREASQLLLGKLPASQPLGIKDPRLSLLLPFWKKIFRSYGIAPSFVIALRHPLSAIGFQEQFKTQDREEALWTWVSYLLTCLEQSEGHRRIIVDYDELLNNPTDQMKRVAHLLQLDLDPTLLDAYRHGFVDLTMRHFNKKKDHLRSRSFWQDFAMEIYQVLFRVATEQSSFDEIQSSFQKWKNQFELMKPALSLEETKNLKLFILRETNKKLQQTNKEQLQSLIDLNKNLVEKCALIATLYAERC
ncbi:MAG: hypothetical protein K2W99_06425 [Chthoniobacterales bacterium]|nr:hypothetical protein [Chthoniobacterales bacterium]